MLEFSMAQQDKNPYTVDPFWAGLSAPPNDENYDIVDDEANELVERYGEYWVRLVNRLFYLRTHREVHGYYPYPLSYFYHVCLMYLNQECELMKQYSMYDSKAKHEQEMYRQKARQNFVGKHQGKMNTF